MFRLSRSAAFSLLGILAILAIFSSWQRGGKEKAPPSVYIQSRKTVSTPKPEPRPDSLVGDHSLRDQFSLGDMVLQEEHYEVELTDGSIAVLTLDPALQSSVNSVLERTKAPKAAIVVMRTDGTILALAGRTHRSKKPKHKLATSVWAPAASVFKIVTAAALVHAGVNPSSKICYHGGLRSIDESNLSDNPRLDGACNDLGYGLAKSQNAIIAKLSHLFLNSKLLGEMAQHFGFGIPVDFALEAEPGTITLPTEDLEFAKVAAGFWNTEISPLGGAILANVVASGGMRITPRIVSEVREKNRSIPVSSLPPERVIEAKVAEAVAEMMAGTVRFGTAYKGFHDGKGRSLVGDIKIAGKTGSLTRTEPSYLAYSWFVGFAPAESPEIVIAVLLGNEAKWHLKAHTAARLVLESLY